MFPRGERNRLRQEDLGLTASLRGEKDLRQPDPELCVEGDVIGVVHDRKRATSEIDPPLVVAALGGDEAADESDLRARDEVVPGADSLGLADDQLLPSSIAARAVAK